MKTLSRILALLLAFCLCFGLAACGQSSSESSSSSETESSSSESSSESSEAEPTDEPDEEKPLVVAYDPFSGKFSPFFADTAYDQDVASMTQLGLLTTDRVGAIIYNSIEGETVEFNGTPYEYKGLTDIKVTLNDDGSAVYNIKIRDDVKFADGEPMTIDDVIFTYYVLCDPSYVGSTTLSSYPIVGLQDYRTQTTSELYDKYSAIVADIYAAGPDYTVSGSESFTQEQCDRFWELLAEQWKDDLLATAGFIATKYGAYIGDIGGTADDLADEGWMMALLSYVWGYGEVSEDGTTLTLPTTGASFVLAEARPTVDDLYAETYAKYEGDVVAYFGTEASDASVDILATASDKAISEFASSEPELADGIPNIAGIKKIDEYTVEVTTSTFSAPAIYQICGITVAPLHYYGDPAKYDYENNQFGFDFGDLSSVEAKTSNPLGAGPYKFVEYSNKVVYFEANENYYKGEPKIKYVQFKETAEADKVSALKTGDADISNPSGSIEKFKEIRATNDNGELDGNVLTTSLVDNLGYGYIGINADTVKVGDDPASDASKNLRKALATVLAVYRDVSIDSYYGDMAEVINYPISNTSWAAPQKSDADYRVAYSVDVDGNDIYTSDMDAEAKYAAALQAAVGYLKAAGFTYDEAAGVFTAAPEGAKLEYEVLIPADGKGDHPNFAVLTETRNALETIGITLTINDLSDSAVLWDRMDAGTQELWSAAWGSTIDPDMYQVYHSSGIVGRGGSDSNHYHIDDPELDELILSGRTSADQSYRKSVYKAALDVVMDWAVEIPCYQRQNVILFSTERINVDTLTPDITTFWGWMNDIELLELN